MMLLSEILNELFSTVEIKTDAITLSYRGETLIADDDRVAKLEIHSLELDSRKLASNSAFLAVKGSALDGRDFIESDAVMNTSLSVIFYELNEMTEQHQDAISKASCLCVGVLGLKKKLSLIASVFYDHPSQKLQVYGATGTNGKTSCCYLLAQAFNTLGYKTAFMGTIGNGAPDALQPSPNTTLDAIALQSQLAEFVEQGFTHICMEVSSHALDQYRAAAVYFYAVLLTNLSQDHLDYHVTMEAYAAAKKKLFTEFSPVLAVINVTGEFGREIQSETNAEFVVTFGNSDSSADVYSEDIVATTKGLSFTVESQTVDIDIQSSLLGLVNVENITLVATVLLALGVDLSSIQSSIADCHAAPGRMEMFSNESLPVVVVDYAHTPDAIQQALQSCRVHCQGELWIVFGCGGDRDQSKRALMGQFAEQFADRVILSNDNPRTEAPEKIFADISSGMSSNPEILEDRHEAIHFAIDQATAKDLILIAGKGHEQGQIFADTVLPFSDRDVVKKCLRLAA